MRDEGNHYRDRTPQRVVFLDAECHADERRSEGWRHAFTFRIAVTLLISYRHGREVSRERRVWHDTDSLWAYVVANARVKPQLWVVAHNLGFDLSVCDFWRCVSGGCGRLVNYVINDPPTALTWAVGNRLVRLVDFMNYCPLPLEEIGQLVKTPKMRLPDFGSADGDWLAYCARDVDILANAFAVVVAAVDAYGSTCWGATMASCAWRVYKKHFKPRKVFRVTDKYLRRVERESYFAGECAAYYVGVFRERVVHADVNSLYPWVMMHGLFPVRPVGSGWTTSADELRKRVCDGPCVARVYLDTIDQAYPVFNKERNTRAVGKFWTALAGAELRHALTTGAVVAVRDWVHYEGYPLFTSWVSEVYKLRLRARDGGDAFASQVYKLMLNAISGKWAQQSHEWTECPGVLPLKEFGVWWDRTVGPGVRDCYRAVCGTVQKKLGKADHKEARPAVAACITAGARDRMRTLRAVAGGSNCLYQDTDSLILRADGWDRLVAAGHHSGTALGAMRFQGQYSTATVYGRKRYILDNRLTAAGVTRGQDVRPDGLYERIDFQRLRSIVDAEPNGSVGYNRRWINIHELPLESELMPDGRCMPLQLFQE